MPPLTLGNWQAREGRVSASEVGALMPEGHPYLSPLDVYRRLTGDPFLTEPSFAMRLGSILEPAILRAAGERWGWRLIANGHTYRHPTCPLCATPDARIVGERGLVEVKYSANPTGWQFIPPYVYWQVQAQMMCTGTHKVEIVALAGGLKRFPIERNKKAGRMIAIACRDMLDRVADGNPPDAPEEPASFNLDVRTSNIPPSMIGVL